MQTSPYEPFDPGKKQVRLLNVRQDESGSFICQTEIFGLFDEARPEYVAASYIWGRDQDIIQIQLNEIPWAIRPNLLSVLQAWRSCSKQVWLASGVQDMDSQFQISSTKAQSSRTAICQIAPGQYHEDRCYRGQVCTVSPQTSWIWIDALCIDQQNNTERGQQVAMMAEIYNNACVVLAFVGRGVLTNSLLSYVTSTQHANWLQHTRDANQSTCVIRLRAPDTASMCQNTATPNYVRAAVDHLLGSEYWQRAWTAQETAIAGPKRLILTDGRNYMPYEDLSSVDTTAFALKNLDGVLTKSAALIEKVIRYRDRKCKDWRDHVYAFLCIGNTETRDQPDYATTREQLLAFTLRQTHWRVRCRGDAIFYPGALQFQPKQSISRHSRSFTYYVNAATEVTTIHPAWGCYSTSGKLVRSTPSTVGQLADVSIGVFFDVCASLCLLLGVNLRDPCTKASICESFTRALLLDMEYGMKRAGNSRRWKHYNEDKAQAFTSGDMDEHIWRFFMYHYDAYQEDLHWVNISKEKNGRAGYLKYVRACPQARFYYPPPSEPH